MVAMMLMDLLAMAVAVLALLRAVRSAVYILAEIVDAGRTLFISVAWLNEAIKLLFPRRRAPSAEAVKRAHGTHC
jgi:hypothetical protein